MKPKEPYPVDLKKLDALVKIANHNLTELSILSDLIANTDFDTIQTLNTASLIDDLSFVDDIVDHFTKLFASLCALRAITELSPQDPTTTNGSSAKSGAS